MNADEPVTNSSYGGTSASIVNIIFGIWTLISPFVLGFTRSPRMTWINVIVGVVVIVLSGIQISTHDTAGLGWINFLLGLWLIVSGFVFGMRVQPVYFWNEVVFGILIAIVSLWSTSKRTSGVVTP